MKAIAFIDLYMARNKLNYMPGSYNLAKSVDR